MQFDVTLGPSFQITTFERSIGNQSEQSGAIALSALLEYKVSSQTDFIFDYNMQFVEEASGKRTSYLKTGFEFEFIKNFEFDAMLNIDRVAEPIAINEAVQPESNDYRLVLSIGYDF